MPACVSFWAQASQTKPENALNSLPMSIYNSILRFTEYYGRHGFRATMQRVLLALRRSIFANGMVVFYCDLDKRTLPAAAIPSSIQIERVSVETALSQEDRDAILELWNPKLAAQSMNERFAKGASLWLIKVGGRLAGYGWTLRGNTIAPSYFPMGPTDVQFFDFFVVPKFRGRAIQWLLTVHILQVLATENGGRAFADTGEWNQAQLASFRMTPFRRLGMARSFTVFGHTFTSWDGADKKIHTQMRGSEQKPLAMVKLDE